MKGSPIDAPIVSLQNILDDDIIRAKKFRLHRQSTGLLLLHLCIASHGFGIVSTGAATAIASLLFFAQSGRVPHPHGLIERRRNDQIFTGMKGGAHDVVIVTRQHAQATAAGKVPQAQRLIVRRTQDPRKLCGVGMKLHRANVIQMSQQSKQAAAEFVVPHFDLVVVATRYEQRFGQMKIDAADGTVVLFEAINHCPDAVVPAVPIRAATITQSVIQSVSLS